MDLKKEEVIAYYSRRDIQEEMLEVSKDREIAVCFSGKGFGKRPDILQFENDIGEFAKQGVTSFHISEERWRGPLELKTGMSRKELDNLRIGWDLVFDIDSPSPEYSRFVAELIRDSLRFHDVTNIGCKFSGNKGFHLVVPFESMPTKVNNKEVSKLFPDLARIIAEYLTDMIEEPLKSKIKELNLDIDIEDLLKVDTVLISSRHMFRAPYSLHEKSGLASIPVDIDKIHEFKREHAKPENVITSIKFMDFDDKFKNEASRLIVQAYDWNQRDKRIIELPKEEKSQEFMELTYKVDEDFFPPCIKLGLEGLEDGKKRFLFILQNFLRSAGWGDKEIGERLRKWNENNEDPLKESYLTSQISWHNRQKEKKLPPNCPNLAYYKDLRICNPDNLCNKIKNPLNYSIRKSRFKQKPAKKTE
ncbi:hypothetical protein HOA59_01140 [archaeon]|jgi:hypothetical protein|nr:hypothetical protein [archaeon]MBT6824022.1 hypothetical protein [archaeon]MBT7107255.1 hypothetical protein [archaeon]MBT7297176.1 hypothetical protein [archaeon]